MQEAPSSASSTVAHPSPISAPRPLARRPDSGRQRSAIACVHCRKSKVKCETGNGSTKCAACQKSGRECLYPETNNSMARRESIAGTREPPELESSRPRKRRAITTVSDNFTSKELSVPPSGDLDLGSITPQVWVELVEIFQQHFAMDLPFLHYPNFKEPLQHSDSTSQPLDSDPTQRQLLRLPDAPQELLFAFLALTARFHNSLINHHIQANTALPDKVPPAIAVAEMYARAARTQLYSYSNGTVALKQTQTLLMLAVHDWSIGRGRQAFAYDLGTAVRALQFDQLDCMDKVTSAEVQRAEGSEYTKMVNGQKQTPKSLRERVIDEESQRRTVWSGYIVDRYFGCRKHPPSMLNVQDMALQLPSSDEAFTFGQRKVTRMLNETDESFENRLEIALQQEIRVTRDDSNRDYDHDHEMDDLDSEDLSEIGSKEGILSRWIKAVTMLGAVTEWSCAGGRRSGSKKEQAIPPWDPSSKFSRLTGDLSAFENSLPRNLKYSKSNTNAHHSSGGKASTTPYIMINVVRFLCTILLHREYLPFVALDSPKPEGPTKAPLLNPRNPPNDSKYWEASARRCFEAARKLVDLLSECQERKILPETPLVALAIYIAGFCGVYSRAFPHMDPDRLMYLGLAREKVREEPVAKAYALILQMCPRMIMAFPYIDRLPNAIDYYEKRQHHHGAHHSKDNSTEGEVGNGEETTEWTGLDGTSTFTRDHMADASLPDPVVLQQLLANFLEKVLPPEQREVSGALHPYPARSDSTRPPGLTSFTPVNNPASPPATPSVISDHPNTNDHLIATPRNGSVLGHTNLEQQANGVHQPIPLGIAAYYPHESYYANIPLGPVYSPNEPDWPEEISPWSQGNPSYYFMNVHVGENVSGPQNYTPAGQPPSFAIPSR